MPLKYMCPIEISKWSRRGYTKSQDLEINVLFCGDGVASTRSGMHVGTQLCYKFIVLILP